VGGALALAGDLEDDVLIRRMAVSSPASRSTPPTVT
jgi:hypothetical protein